MKIVSFAILASIPITLLSMPISLLASVPSLVLPDVYPSNIYRVSEHVHSLDHSTLSNHYYSKAVKGYDSLFFTYQKFVAPTTDLHDRNFESSGVRSFWAEYNSGPTLRGYPIIEKSINQSADGRRSLYIKSSSPDTNFVFSGVNQTFSHPLPLSADLKTTYKLFPTFLSRTNNNVIDSLVEVRFNLLYWQSKSIVPAIVFVYSDSNSVSSPINFRNDTNSVYLMRKLVPNQWNNQTENLTNIAESYWGSNFMRDQGVRNIELGVNTRNFGIAEAYFDSIDTDIMVSDYDVYKTQERQLALWSSRSLRLIPGVELESGSNYLFSVNVPSANLSKFRSESGISLINNLHKEGLYVGLAHPFQTDTQFTNANASQLKVDMVDIYGNREKPIPLYLTDTRIWDDYLKNKIIAMATATPNSHTPLDLERMNTDAFAIYTFSDSSDPKDMVESMAMGRSFIETVALGGNSSGIPMKLYFTSEGDQVPMGRYPIIVDERTETVKLHIILTDIPSSYPKLNLVIKRDGVPIGKTVSIKGGIPIFDETFSFAMPPANYTYFRYEIQDPSTNKPLAFSQPLIFVKVRIFPGFWTALVPEKSAGFDLPANLVSFNFSDNRLSEQVNARLPQAEEERATVKIFIPGQMFENNNLNVSSDCRSCNLDWNFNSISKILTVNSVMDRVDSQTISVMSQSDSNGPKSYKNDSRTVT